MSAYVLRRIPSALAVLAVSSVVIFALLRLVPGDPAASIAGPDASDEAVQSIRDQMGLTGSPISQYFAWVGGILRLDPGRSLTLGGEISGLLADAFANTLVLAGAALVLAVLLTLLVSVGSVLIDRPWLNSAVAGFTSLAVAIPNFVTGVLLVMVFGVVWRVLPAGGTPPNGLWAQPDITAQYLLLPVICLALPIAAGLTRFLTESLRSQLTEPYVVTAEALGISRRRILFRQVLPNALPSTVTVLGLQIGHLLGGAVIVESIFAWPGLGHLAERSISVRDYPVIQVLLLLSVGVFIVVQLATDLFNAWLDPRIRLGGGA
jgi:peptide/nickel transport system permease protein